ncbi:MAG: DinB family protein, partial [Azonexus sp.]
MTTSPSHAARSGGRAERAEALRASRQRTLELLDAYAAHLGDALTVPYSPQLNPPRWEAGHIAWFQDYWIARNRQRSLGCAADPDHARAPGRMPKADAWYNSSLIAHAKRWTLPLPDLAATRAYLDAVME